VAGSIGQSLKALLLRVDHNHCNDAIYGLASDINGNIFNKIYSIFIRSFSRELFVSPWLSIA